MQFFKVTSTLVRPSTGITWFSTGDTFNCQEICDGQRYYQYIKYQWTWRAYLLHATDLYNYRDFTNTPTRLDDHTLTWTRIWYSKQYYDEFVNDPWTKPIWDRELDYFAKHGIVYTEQHDTIEAKFTSNGHPYLGDYYHCRPDLNLSTAINN